MKCSRASCLLLRKPVLERQVLMQKKVVFSDAGHVEDGGLTSQSPCPWEDGGLISQSPSPPLNAGRDFSKEGEGNRTKRSREGVAKFPSCRRARSIPLRQVMVGVRQPGLVIPHHVISASRHSGSTGEGQQISRS